MLNFFNVLKVINHLKNFCQLFSVFFLFFQKSVKSPHFFFSKNRVYQNWKSMIYIFEKNLRAQKLCIITDSVNSRNIGTWWCSPEPKTVLFTSLHHEVLSLFLILMDEFGWNFRKISAHSKLFALLHFPQKCPYLLIRFIHLSFYCHSLLFQLNSKILHLHNSLAETPYHKLHPVVIPNGFPLTFWHARRLIVKI
jgi:hypothetical protein